MTIDEYLKCRVEDQICWYDSKSILFKKRSNRISIFLIILTCLISLSSILIPYFTDSIKVFSITICILSSLSTILLTYSKIFKYEELYLKYRLTSERLKQEKHLFIMNVGDYKNVNKQEIFISRFESILLNENNQWIKLFSNI